MSSLSDLSIPDFVELSKGNRARRVNLVWDPEGEGVAVSHPFLGELGVAINQLEVPARDGPLLAARGISSASEFLANRTGIVTRADEQSGHLPEDPWFAHHLGGEWEHSSHRLTRQIRANAERNGEATDVEADHPAGVMMQTPHPIWGHCGPAINAALVTAGWERG